MKLRICLLLMMGAMGGVSIGYWMLRSAGAKSVSAAAAASSRLPRFSIDHTTHDFGVMDVGESGTHEFIVRNDGAAPLKVSVINTTCKCTSLNAPQGEIAPGQSRAIKLEWKTIEPVDGFRHGGTLSTNDPQIALVNIFVEGKVRARIANRPEAIVLNGVLAGERREAQALVVSHVWDNFTLRSLECTLPGVEVDRWQFDPDLLNSDPRIRAAQGIKLTLGSELAVGSHHGAVRYRVDTSEDPAAGEKIYELPIIVEVVTPFSIHGRTVEGNALIWGAIPRGKGRKDSAMLIVRNAPADFEIQQVRVQPDVLKTALRRTDQQTNGAARFAFDLELPADAAPINCMTPNTAVVTLQTTHPKFPQVRFYVEFAIIE